MTLFVPCPEDSGKIICYPEKPWWAPSYQQDMSLDAHLPEYLVFILPIFLTLYLILRLRKKKEPANDPR